MEKVFEGTIAQGTRIYNFTASDHQVTINMTVVDPNNRALFLKYVPFEQFDRDYPDPSALTQAAPELWTQFGTTFIVGPSAPDQTYSLYMRYLKNPTTIDGDSDTFDAPDDFAEVIVDGMWYRALEADDEWDLARVVQDKYETGKQRMAKRLLARQAGEPITIPNSRGGKPDWLVW